MGTLKPKYNLYNLSKGLSKGWHLGYSKRKNFITCFSLYFAILVILAWTHIIVCLPNLPMFTICLYVHIYNQILNFPLSFLCICASVQLLLIFDLIINIENVPRGNNLSLHNVHLTSIFISDIVHTFLAQFLSMAASLCRINPWKSDKVKSTPPSCHGWESWEKSVKVFSSISTRALSHQTYFPSNVSDECLC